MRIQSIKIKGYKSVDTTGVQFPIGNMTAFIGKNSAGKSNILEALECFFNNSTLGSDAFYRNNTEIPIEITLDFLLDDGDSSFDHLLYSNQEQLIKIQKLFTCGQKPQTNIFGSWKYTEEDLFNPQTRYTASSIRRVLADTDVQAFLQENFAGQTITTHEQYLAVLRTYWATNFDSMPKEWDNTPQSAPKEVLALLPSYYYLPVTYTVNDETKLGKNSRFQTIYNHILGSIDTLINDDHITRIKRQIDSLYRKAGIERRRIEVNRILASIDNTNSGTNMHLEFAPLDLTALSQRAPTVMIDDGFDSSVGSKGHGVQRDSIFRLLRAYLQLKNTEQRTNFILAVDEPELYMHPTYKRALYSSFIELSQSGCQIMYTTHDPSFVSVAQFDDIHIVRKDPGPSQHTNVTYCSLSTIKKTEVFNTSYRGKSDSAIRSELHHKCHGDQNEGFFADKIILVEGATEQYSLPIYFKRVGFDLDNANISIVTADSVTLIAQLCTIFSALSIPCYCIFDGDKPKPSEYEGYLRYRNSNTLGISEAQKNKYVQIGQTLDRNRNLIKCISGYEINDFQNTTFSENYTMWERNFEVDIHEKIRGYKKTHDTIIRQEGISSSSKPLVAVAIAEHYAANFTHLPRHLNTTIKALVTQIKAAGCIPLRMAPRFPTITLHSEVSDGLFPVFSCAAGRNTIVDADAAICYAEGDFPNNTDCLIHIQGESMSPLIPNNCYVAVEYCESPSPGDYVICMLDGGEMVCKQYIHYEQHGQSVSVLKSLNRNCSDIEITEGVGAIFQGKVLGTRRNPARYETGD